MEERFFYWHAIAGGRNRGDAADLSALFGVPGAGEPFDCAAGNRLRAGHFVFDGQLAAALFRQKDGAGAARQVCCRIVCGNSRDIVAGDFDDGNAGFPVDRLFVPDPVVMAKIPAP